MGENVIQLLGRLLEVEGWPSCCVVVIGNVIEHNFIGTVLLGERLHERVFLLVIKSLGRSVPFRLAEIYVCPDFFFLAVWCSKIFKFESLGVL
jgi:hypothetical protein